MNSKDMNVQNSYIPWMRRTGDWKHWEFPDTHFLNYWWHVLLQHCISDWLRQSNTFRDIELIICINKWWTRNTAPAGLLSFEHGNARCQERVRGGGSWSRIIAERQRRRRTNQRRIVIMMMREIGCRNGRMRYCFLRLNVDQQIPKGPQDVAMVGFSIDPQVPIQKTLQAIPVLQPRGPHHLLHWLPEVSIWILWLHGNHEALLDQREAAVPLPLLEYRPRLPRLEEEPLRQLQAAHCHLYYGRVVLRLWHLGFSLGLQVIVPLVCWILSACGPGDVAGSSDGSSEREGPGTVAVVWPQP